MSERMIELQRARLGLPPMGTTGGMPAPSTSSTQSRQAASGFAVRDGSGGGGASHLHHHPHHHHHHHHVASAALVPPIRQTAQQAAAVTMLSEDEQLKGFLQRLQRRDDSHPLAESGPTVPTALSRRMLHRQGVGYLDDTVAALTSASADRFLATVFQQAVACRDRRLKGADLARDETRQRRKRQLLYKQAAHDRKRRKQARTEARRKYNLDKIAAAHDLKHAATTEAEPTSKSKKKKKKPEKEENGSSKKEAPAKQKTQDDQDESSDDSIEEEELYYEKFYSGLDHGADHEEDEDDESRFILLLRDLEKPLEAWDFHLTGKVGLGAIPLEAEEETAPDPEAENNGGTSSFARLENGVSGDNSRASPMKPKEQGESAEGGSKSAIATSRATTPIVGDGHGVNQAN